MAWPAVNAWRPVHQSATHLELRNIVSNTQESSQQKPLAPLRRRLDQAREQGPVARSRALSNAPATLDPIGTRGAPVPTY
jgi:hypothetical protein